MDKGIEANKGTSLSLRPPGISESSGQSEAPGVGNESDAGAASTYSEYRREQATRSMNLYRRIEAMGDTELMGLWEDEGRARFTTECTNEIHAEWAVDARKIAPGSEGCDCDVCAIGRALSKGEREADALRDILDVCTGWGARMNEAKKIAAIEACANRALGYRAKTPSEAFPSEESTS